MRVNNTVKEIKGDLISLKKREIDTRPRFDIFIVFSLWSLRIHSELNALTDVEGVRVAQVDIINLYKEIDFRPSSHLKRRKTGNLKE